MFDAGFEEIVAVILVSIGSVGTYVARQPWIWRKLIGIAIKFGFSGLMKGMQVYHDTVEGGKPHAEEDRDIIKAMADLCAAISIRWGYDIKPRRLEHEYNKKSTKRLKDERNIRKADKKTTKKTFKERQKTMKKLKQGGHGSRFGRHRIRNMFDIRMLLVLLTCAVLLAPVAQAVEFAGPGNGFTSDLSWFPKTVKFGFTWNVDGTEMSKSNHVSFSVLGWKDVVFFDLGLNDPEDIDVNEANWVWKLDVTGGVTVDVLEAAKQWPLIEPFIDYIPDYVYIGAGYQLEMSHPHSGGPFISAGLTW